MNEVIVLVGAGSIGQAIARRVSAGKQVVLSDLREANAEAAAEVMRNAGFDVSTTTVDVSSRDSVHALVETASARGDITRLIHAAGVSPSQAPVDAILTVDLYGTAVVLEEFGNVIARGNALRVMAEAVRWAKRGARINTISPGIITTPLALDELTGLRGEGYRRMLERRPAGRAGTPDEVADVAALLLGPDAGFITGSDFLMDGGVTASYFYGELAPQ